MNHVFLFHFSKVPPLLTKFKWTSAICSSPFIEVTMVTKTNPLGNVNNTENVDSVEQKKSAAAATFFA